ncbi:hypothetical protein COL91_07395 [Bacillus pseudomycoides]|nr:hypothetical protein COL91_07395 [Bacillus pseudomycoides]
MPFHSLTFSTRPIISSFTERAKVAFIAKWIAGNILGDDWLFVFALLPWLAVLIPFTLYKAIGVGVALEKERRSLLIAAVSVTGGIAFIGIMAPHIAKSLVGPRHQLFIPVAILIGGWLLLLADTIGRHIVEPSGIPAGVMVALIGAPYFIPH